MLTWVQKLGEITADADYGTYKITFTFPWNVVVELVSPDPRVSFFGTHNTIAEAKSAAETDEEYRTHIWETL
jgi:hypothetical protein